MAAGRGKRRKCRTRRRVAMAWQASNSDKSPATRLGEQALSKTQQASNVEFSMHRNLLRQAFGVSGYQVVTSIALVYRLNIVCYPSGNRLLGMRRPEQLIRATGVAYIARGEVVTVDLSARDIILLQQPSNQLHRRIFLCRGEGIGEGGRVPF